MNTKIIGIVVAIIVILGGIYLVTQKQDKNTTAESDTQTEGANSLKGMLAQNKNQQCTFSSDESGDTTTGTVYFSKNQFRTDISSSVDGQETTSHMIYDGSLMSVWTDGEPDGFQMSLDNTEPANPNTSSNNFDPEKPVDFKCQSWTPDNSMFTLPSNVTFQNMSEIMQGLGLPQGNEGVDAMTSDQTPAPKLDSSVCDNVPAESKAACLAAIAQ